MDWSLMSWPLSLLLYLLAVAGGVLWTVVTFLAGVVLAGRRGTARAVTRAGRAARRCCVAAVRHLRRDGVATGC